MRVVISGAATGIGAETVKILKARGAEITALDIAKPEGVDRWIAVDMSDMAAVAAQLDASYDVLINNAGLPPRPGNAEVLLAVNVFGLRALTRAVLPKLKDGARIVNTASRAGQLWRENIEEAKALLALDGPQDLPAFIAARNIDPARAYNLSKEAVIIYTKGLTQPLLKRNIRVNSVSPAPIATRLLDDFMAMLGDRAANALTLPGRAGSAREAAEAIVFLDSEASGWIKGHDLIVDGGVAAMLAAQELGLHYGE